MKPVYSMFLAAVLGLGTVAPSVAQADEHEKVVTMDEIPAPAKAALLREAKGAPIQRVEEETKNGKKVYEGVIQEGDKETGILVDAQGKVLGHHAEKNEKDEHK
jgi:uncharacterized membrane protein YkoI